MAKNGEYYRGRIFTDIVILVKDVDISKNTVYAKVMENPKGDTGQTMSYVLDSFDYYYVLDENYYSVEEDKVETRVIFKMTKKEKFSTYTLEPHCIAFLLDIPANYGNVMSYMHVGQHNESSIEFFYECKLASFGSYSDLKEELESLGYVLDVCSRWVRR